MTDRDLLAIATSNYRDLTEAVAAMWQNDPYGARSDAGFRPQPDLSKPRWAPLG